MMTLLTLVGHIITTAHPNPEAEKSVRCMAAKSNFFLDPKLKATTCFMEYKIGDKIMTLDEPFYLGMQAGHGLKVDDKEKGMLVCYCMHYGLGGDAGIIIHKAGLVWWQHMDKGLHHSHLGALAAAIQAEMTTFFTTASMMHSQMLKV